MADSVAEIQKAKKLYFFIGMLLFFFTVVTVLVATVEALDFGDHGFDGVDATIGLIIAAFFVGDDYFYAPQSREALDLLFLRISSSYGLLLFVAHWLVQE